MPKKKRKSAPITSFLIRSITGQDRGILDALKRSTNNATDSGAILHAVAKCRADRERADDAERDRDAMEQKAAALVDAIERQRIATADVAKAVKAFGDVKNAAFIRSMY
jgi:hypothetical protein